MSSYSADVRIKPSSQMISPLETSPLKECLRLPSVTTEYVTWQLTLRYFTWNKSRYECHCVVLRLCHGAVFLVHWWLKIGIL